MSTETTNLKLEKPGTDEFYDVNVQNRNMDKLDSKVKALEDGIGGISVPVNSVNTKTGNVVLSAGDIKAADNKTIEQKFTALASDLADYTKQTPYGGTTTGVANTYAIATPTITALTEGMSVCVKIHTSNNSSASTLNWGNTGAKLIVTTYGSTPFLANGGIYTLRYSGGGYVLQGEDDPATETTRGVVELATTAEVTAGTDTTRAVTPKALKDQGYFNQSNYGSIATLTNPTTLTLAHANTVCYSYDAAITIPANATVAFPVGTQITVFNFLSANTTIFVPSSGVTLISKDTKRTIDGLYASATLIKLGTNQWILIGALK